MKISQNKIIIEQHRDLLTLEYALKKARANILFKKIEIIYFPRVDEVKIEIK